MIEDYLVCPPHSHLCDVQSRWGHHRYALVVEKGKPRGVVPATALRGLGEDERADPDYTVEKALLSVSRCSEDDSIGYVGAKLLRDQAFAAVVYRKNSVVGVAPLLDILQWLISPPALVNVSP
jgi:hypothetical protein